MLSHITPNYINEILNQCNSLPYETSGQTGKKFLSIIIKSAEAEEFLKEEFPFKQLITFPTTPPKYVAYSKEQIKTLLKAAKKDHTHYVEILLCLFVGLRTGEVRGLNYDNIDFSKHTVTVSQQITGLSYVKGSNRVNPKCVKPPKSQCSVRTIRVPDIVIKELMLRKKENELFFKSHPQARKYWKNYVCIGRGGEIKSPNTLTEGIKRICAQNGLPAITCHGLRHLCATILLEQGVPILRISHILGHASPTTTFDIYCGEIEGRDSIIDFLSNNLDPIVGLARRVG